MLKNFVKIDSKVMKYSIILLSMIIALFFAIWSVDDFIQYSSLPIGLVKAIIGIFTLSLVDDVIFYKINTIDAINNKNLSYAVFYLANAIIIAACIASA
jgi:hypothetical protein